VQARFFSTVCNAGEDAILDAAELMDQLDASGPVNLLVDADIHLYCLDHSDLDGMCVGLVVVCILVVASQVVGMMCFTIARERALARSRENELRLESVPLATVKNMIRMIEEHEMIAEADAPATHSSSSSSQDSSASEGDAAEAREDQEKKSNSGSSESPLNIPKPEVPNKNIGALLVAAASDEASTTADDGHHIIPSNSSSTTAPPRSRSDDSGTDVDSRPGGGRTRQPRPASKTAPPSAKSDEHGKDRHTISTGSKARATASSSKTAPPLTRPIDSGTDVEAPSRSRSVMALDKSNVGPLRSLSSDSNPRSAAPPCVAGTDMHPSKSEQAYKEKDDKSVSRRRSDGDSPKKKRQVTLSFSSSGVLKKPGRPGESGTDVDEPPASCHAGSRPPSHPPPRPSSRASASGTKAESSVRNLDAPFASRSCPDLHSRADSEPCPPWPADSKEEKRTKERHGHRGGSSSSRRDPNDRSDVKHKSSRKSVYNDDRSRKSEHKSSRRSTKPSPSPDMSAQASTREKRWHRSQRVERESSRRPTRHGNEDGTKRK